MERRVVITGLGTLSGLGNDAETLWEGVCAGRSGIGPIESFDPAPFKTRVAGEVRGFNVKKIVPKHYRKATKVMARDIELAVGAADQAVRDANLVTPGIEPDGERSYPGPRAGCHIGAGLIAADIDELTEAFVAARDEDGGFDMHKWGAEGMHNLTPLWLLKYLPNMLACHVTIIHDAQGPSNTITCGEASSGLSIGESMRVIQRGAADMGFCGGAESKLNPMAYYRQVLAERLTPEGNDDPQSAVRPFEEGASGTVMGEGGGILILENAETAQQRGARTYAELVGFAAGHSIHPEGHGLEPEPDGEGIAAVIRNALRDAELSAEDIDLIAPLGTAIPGFDRAEANAIRTVFGDRAGEVPVFSATPYVGNCGAGTGAMAAAVAARALAEQTVPARINCDRPLEGLNVTTSEAKPAELNHALVVSPSLGGQNVALVLKRAG